MRKLIGLVLLGLMAAAVMGATTPDKTPKYTFNAIRTTAGGSWAWIDSDSGDVVTVYPAEEDTSGKGKLAGWIGGTRRLWQFLPDSTDVYQFVETTGTDTVITGMDAVFVWSTSAPESLLTNRRSIGLTVIDSTHLKTDSLSRFVATKSIYADTAVVVAIRPPTGKRVRVDQYNAAYGTVECDSVLFAGVSTRTLAGTATDIVGLEATSDSTRFESPDGSSAITSTDGDLVIYDALSFDKYSGSATLTASTDSLNVTITGLSGSYVALVSYGAAENAAPEAKTLAAICRSNTLTIKPSSQLTADHTVVYVCFKP